MIDRLRALLAFQVTTYPTACLSWGLREAWQMPKECSSQGV
jgi:outer membrane lipopolysaccharide assembly protein LptE/RlpB